VGRAGIENRGGTGMGKFKRLESMILYLYIHDPEFREAFEDANRHMAEMLAEHRETRNGEPN